MEIWEMTYNQFCDHYLNNCKYKNAYLANLKAWENRKKDIITDWENTLLEHAENNIIPSDVLQSYIRLFDEERLFTRFSGKKSKGISNFRIPAKIRKIRENQEGLK